MAHATANDEADAKDAANMLTAWRTLVCCLSLLAMVFAAIAMRNAAGSGGAGDLRCSLTPDPESGALPSHGRAAASGEACEYRDNGTWPMCVNTVLPDTASHALHCVRRKCASAFGAGEDCGLDSGNGTVGVDKWCASEVCAEHDHGSLVGKWTCRDAHFRRFARESCKSNLWCGVDSYCDNANASGGVGHCEARVPAGAACQLEDAYAGRSPHASTQCVAGHYCQRQSGSGPLVCTPKEWGAPGTACSWAPPQPRPVCMRGRAYCTDEGVCAALLGAGGACRAAGAAADDDACQYGLGCLADAAAGNGTGACRPLRSLAPGARAPAARFCAPGLTVEEGYCVAPRMEGSPCRDDAACGAGLVCGCGGQHTREFPGTCQRPPLALPATDDAMPHAVTPGCGAEWAALSEHLAHWWKRADPEDAGGHVSRKGAYEHAAHCCMKTDGVGTHAWLLAGAYLTDAHSAEIICHTDVTWLYIMLSVTVFVTCAGCCCACSACCTPTKGAEYDEDTGLLVPGQDTCPEDRALELKERTGIGHPDSAEAPMTRYQLSPGSERVLDRAPGSDPVLDRGLRAMEGVVRPPPALGRHG